MSIPDYPLLFRRRLLEKVWGARRLADLFGHALPEGARVGESWELSDHASGESVIENGPLAGRSLRALMESDAPSLIGEAAATAQGRFPLLVKFVDTSDRLSVQVHPNDAQARELGASDGGKNEAWLVLHADPGAVLWAGPAPGKGRADLERAEAPAEFEACLRALRPRPGDVIPIPAGTVHAIGAGFTICEVQQTSDVTYRVYDWGRPASAQRPLHRRPSFRVARFDAAPSLAHPEPVETSAGIAACALPSPGSFRWRLLAARAPVQGRTGPLPTVVVALEGEAELRTEAAPRETPRLRAGAAALVPATAGAWSLVPDGSFRAVVVEPLPAGGRP